MTREVTFSGAWVRGPFKGDGEEAKVWAAIVSHVPITWTSLRLAHFPTELTQPGCWRTMASAQRGFERMQMALKSDIPQDALGGEPRTKVQRHSDPLCERFSAGITLHDAP